MNKFKIGLYLNNKNYIGVDFSKPQLGNPGSGGTQYMFLCMPYYYMKYFDNVEFVYFAEIIDTLPNCFKSIKVDNLLEAANIANKEKCDIFIYRPTLLDDINLKFLDYIKNTQLKTIAWAHNTPFDLLDRLSENKYIVRYVNVGQEQYDMLRDHLIIYKSTVICNGFDMNIVNNINVQKEKWVTYLGSLIPAKGFHILAEIWKDIIKEIPEAKLKVIGSGQLYNRNARLGKWNIADEEYEKVWRKFLSDENGNKLDSIEFFGTLGIEKFEIMSKSLVGVPNPTGISENCPGSAIEFQAVGTAVVSGAYWGLFDTVDNGRSGYLVKTKQELKEKIIFLLKNENKAVEMGLEGKKFVKEKFNWEKISNEWFRLFYDIMNNKPVKILPLTQNIDFEYKLLSEELRKLKEKYNFLWDIIPPYIKIRKEHRKKLISKEEIKWMIH